MILRAAVLAGGVIGGAMASQFPEFSQQYQQRLGGAVDALAEVVADFDASAQAAGLTRESALAEMQGTAFLDRRRSDMVRTFARYDRLSADLVALETAGPFMRAYHAAHSTDTEVASAALSAFKPAVPLTLAGAIFALAGFLVGAAAISAVLKLLLWPFAGRRQTARGT
ncbi:MULTISPECIES: DUF2937 family protein [Roseobacteraceae]|uniref:DUF2937 family protein n=1 Tax=Roseobacteraceae TaxID=2854170 RepID=UPI001C4537A5|nr:MULTISPECIES: DUF2937 family protein [Roseobacteraceae]MBV7408916.1 DUF2937 family protein [Maritimibacter sp. DP1N21-5]MBY5934397.1 DUF2937 family protein [Tateyamaria omphalii]